MENLAGSEGMVVRRAAGSLKAPSDVTEQTVMVGWGRFGRAGLVASGDWSVSRTSHHFLDRSLRVVTQLSKEKGQLEP